MTMLKTFKSCRTISTEEDYKSVNKQINKYAEDNELIIKNICYDRFPNYIIANVLLSNCPKDVKDIM